MTISLLAKLKFVGKRPADSPSAPPAPWDAPEFLPAKPLGADYGYLDNGRLIGCSQQELIQRASHSGFAPIHLAWTPASPRITTVQQIPFLFEAVRASVQRGLRTAFRNGLLNAAFWAGLILAIRPGLPSLTLLSMLAVFLGLIPAVRAWLGLRNLRHYGPETMAAEARQAQYEVWVASQTITATHVLLAVLVMVAFAEVLVGLNRAVFAAGLVKAAVRQGEYWRLATGVTLHGGVLHFGFNFLAALGLGRLTEVLAGRSRLNLVFMSSALSGSVLGCLLMPHATSVGSSGGLLGLIGFLAVLGYRRRRHLPPDFLKTMAFNIALVAGMGVLAYRIVDNAAHLGGLLCGMAAGWILLPSRDDRVPLPSARHLDFAGTVAQFAFIASGAWAVWKMITL